MDHHTFLYNCRLFSKCKTIKWFILFPVPSFWDPLLLHVSYFLSQCFKIPFNFIFPKALLQWNFLFEVTFNFHFIWKGFIQQIHVSIHHMTLINAIYFQCFGFVFLNIHISSASLSCCLSCSILLFTKKYSDLIPVISHHICQSWIILVDWKPISIKFYFHYVVAQ